MPCLPRLRPLLAAALLSAATAGPAIAGFSPLPVETLHSARLVQGITVIPEPDGRTVLAWTGQNGDPTVMVSQKPAGGPFGVPEPITTTVNAQLLRSVRASDGRMLLAYSTSTNTVPDEYAIRPASGAFGPPQQLPAGDRFVDVGIDATDRVTAVWKGVRAGGLDYIAVSSAPLGGPFPAPTALTPNVDDPSLLPGVAVAGDGAVAVAWRRQEAPDTDVVEVRVKTGTTFEAVQELDRGDVSRPIVTATPDGELLAFWQNGSTLKYAVAAPGAAAFGPPTAVDDLVADFRIVTRNGLTAVAWVDQRQAPSSAIEDPPAEVRVALRPHAGAFGPPEILTAVDAGQRLMLAGTGFDGADTLVTGWTRTTATERALELARRPAGGPFEPAEPVTTLTEDDGTPTIGVLSSGNVIAAWNRRESDDLQTLRTVEVRQLPNASVSESRRCVSVPDPPPPTKPAQGEAPDIPLTAQQLRTNQRIGQAAIRRLNAIRDWLDAGLTTRDLCGGAFGPGVFQPGIETSPFAASLAALTPADPRPLQIARPSGRRGKVTLSARQLLINQRVYQSAVRRANALQARLDRGLTGGDVRDGAITQGKLFDRLRVTGIQPAAPVPASATIVARPTGRGAANTVSLSKKQVRTNQRVAQAAVRRANQLRVILERGFSGDQFQPDTIGGGDLAAEVKPGL